MKHHKPILLCCVILLMLGSGKVIAQDLVYEKEEPYWLSESFVTTKDTRIEWATTPSAGSGSDSTFQIWVVSESTGERIHAGSGLVGMLFVDTSFFAHVQVEAQGIDNYIVRLYHLDQVPNTSTDPLTTTTDPNNIITPPSNQQVYTITVAVFTELPPNTNTVQRGNFFLGFLVFGSILGIALYGILRTHDIMIVKRIPEPQEESDEIT